MDDRKFSIAQWGALLDATVASIKMLSASKGEEYKASDDDQLANFRRRADRLDILKEQVWAIYAGKHWDALEQHIKDMASGRERVCAEPISSRVDDLIVYLLLFKAMVQEKEQERIGAAGQKAVAEAIARDTKRHPLVNFGASDIADEQPLAPKTDWKGAGRA